MADDILNRLSNGSLTSKGDGTFTFSSPLTVPGGALEQSAFGQSRNWDWQDMSTVQKVFDVLSRGQYVSANVAQAMLAGDPDLIRAAWRGLSGQERGDYIDILKKSGISYAPLLGTALNIGLDPTTYIPTTWFKSISKVVGVEKALQKANEVIHAVEPVGKIVDAIGGKFSRTWGMKNPEIMDAGQLLKYGFDQKVVDVAKSWEPLRKATVNADESLWKGFLGVMSPKDADTAYKVYGRLNELTNQVLDGKLAASPELIQAIKQMKGSYLPEVVAGHIQDWIPSRNLFGWFDNPNFAEGRTLKIASKDWVPFLTEYTDGLQQVAKRKTLDEMLDGAALLDNAMSANNPFKGELTRKLGLLNDGKAALPQISKQLQKEMKYWTPVSNLADLGMLYELQLNKAVFQQGLKKYWLTSTDAIQNGWVKALGELPEDLVPRAVMASPGDIAGLLKAHQLEEKIPVAKKMLEQLETSAPGQLQLFNTPVGMGQVNQMAKHVDTLEALKTWLAQTQGNSLMHDVAEMSPELAKKTQAMFKDLGVKLPDTLVATRPDIVKDIKRMTEILDPKTKEGGALLQFYDKALGAWKKQATIIRMPFHLRNFWSNIPMMYMSGVNTYELPGAMAKAAEIQKGGSKLVKVGGLSRTADEWLQLAGGLGVRGRGLVYEAVGSHLVDDIAGLAGGKAGKGIFSTAMDKAYQVGEEAGRAIEDNARLAAFVNRLEKNGGDLKDAAKNTWKYMIQYDQVTPWEKDVARRVIPFYTWMKKNLALQLDGLYRGATLQDLKPAIRMKKQGQMLNMFSQMSDDPSSDQEFKPEFLNSTFSFRLPDNVTQHFNKWMGGNDNLFVSIDLPVQALNDLGLQQLLQKTVSSLSPVAVMANLGMGYKTYPEPYGPVEKFKGEMKAVPWAMTLLPEPLWKPLGMAPMRDRQSGQMVVGAPVKAIEAVNAVSPALAELMKMFPQANARVESENSPWRRLSYFTGVRVTPVNAQEERYYKALDKQNRLREAAKVIAQRGAPLSLEELERLTH